LRRPLKLFCSLLAQFLWLAKAQGSSGLTFGQGNQSGLQALVGILNERSARSKHLIIGVRHHHQQVHRPIMAQLVGARKLVAFPRPHVSRFAASKPH
jgi:hypothetical protein